MTPTPLMKDAVIGRRTAIGMAVVFGAMIVLPPIDQCARELRESGRWKFLSLFEQPPTAASLRQFEDDLAQDSRLAREARTVYQTALTQALGAGNEKIVVGRDGFLFFRKEVDLATGPGFLRLRGGVRRGTGLGRELRRRSDPGSAIADYHRQLQARGIRLVFVPLPAKPSIYPEKVWPGYPLSSGPAPNRDEASLMKTLEAAGVDVLEVTGALWEAKDREEIYLRRDTHWTPRGVEIVARKLAEHLRPLLGPPQAAYGSTLRSVSHDGDLLRMIELLPESRLRELQTVTIRQIAERGGDDAPVLLLGDSFTNIYSRRELEWGERAGLGEQLMLDLGLPVQVLALNGGGATAVRELLGRKPSALQAKKVVIWACSCRDFFDTAVSWDSVALPAAIP